MGSEEMMVACSLESEQIGKRNLIAGLWTMGAFMFLGFVLVYLRDFAPDAAAWAADYGNGKHFETRLAHVHGTLFGFLNIVIGFLLYQFPVCVRGTKMVSWLSLGGIMMPFGILGEVLLGLSPVFVLLGAMSMTLALILYGVALFKHRKKAVM